MNIIWQYLDKRSAAVNALKDYSSMEFIIKNTDIEIADVHGKMEGVPSSQIDGMPRQHNPQSGEDRILKGIEEIDVLQERYRQAMEYMEWFKPAWSELSEDERFLLETFYQGDEDNQTGAVYDICDRYKIERTSAYKKKNRALAKLAVLLFGK
ncbi:hypothetical protein [Acetobacterium malicum]|uniref:hypothetical protein n=1 Tax=Acetobacterium malicum TaxID=52692 RepID=UPI0035948781